MARALKEGSKGRCLHCGMRIEVVKVPTGKIVRGPFWRLEWHHVSSNDYDWGRHCHDAPKATPKPHTKKVSPVIDINPAYDGGYKDADVVDRVLERVDSE